MIAFLKLNGNIGGKPTLLPARHLINGALLAAILGLTAYFTLDQSPWVFWTLTGLALHFKVLPADAPADSGSEGLGTGFLGGKTGGKALG